MLITTRKQVMRIGQLGSRWGRNFKMFRKCLDFSFFNPSLMTSRQQQTCSPCSWRGKVVSIHMTLNIHMTLEIPSDWKLIISFCMMMILTSHI